MSARPLPLLGLLGLLLATACKEPPPPPPPPPAAPRPTAAQHYLGNAPDGKLHVYFLDVGQGDSALIVSPEGRTVLIDAGAASSVNHLVNRLPELLASRLDLVVLTHPAPDHYGGMDAVQKIADPRRLLEPQLPDAPAEYDTLLTALGSRGVEIFSPAPNPSQPQELTRLPLGKGAELTVLWPRAPTEPLVQSQGSGAAKGSQHAANSIVLRLTYGKTSVLFAGDAGADAEAALVKRGAELRSTLLKVGAHGADLATSKEFLHKVEPRAAILSVGAGNTLGVPAQPVLERLKGMTAPVFRTDQYGEVHAVSDGTQFVLTTQKLAPGESSSMQHVFAPVEEKTALEVPPPPAPVATKPAPVKPASAKAGSPKEKGDEELTRFGKVVDVDSLNSTSERGTRPGKKAHGAGGVQYVASKKRDLFHKESCRSARQISPDNLIIYPSREAAMKERKPANDCKP
jgi:competence protein ComEC